MRLSAAYQPFTVLLWSQVSSQTVELVLWHMSYFPLYPSCETKGKLAKLWRVPGRCAVATSECTGQCCGSVHTVWQTHHVCLPSSSSAKPRLFILLQPCMGPAVHRSVLVPAAPGSPPLLFVAHGFEHSGFLGNSFCTHGLQQNFLMNSYKIPMCIIITDFNFW